MGQIEKTSRMVGLTTQKIACAHSKSVARLIEKGISRIGKPLEDINTAIENAGKLKFINLKRM
jgi:biopolymer transport protein ExbB